ncbi:hypothetical protein DYB25_003109 [Aphanomyces astaci]|uniref:PhoD-like phosphatase metallophosphatase domain-containing protein n=1 Tax=Aphanomyces astaci TaxID=112090 RepID=A0A397AH64_APHAT|nr:hypothetical protein DYB36_004693 [Aphanomyces astaci]RHY05108.1 hypothetical protein DYB25_003109 [Aphanomyces astaci]
MDVETLSGLSPVNWVWVGALTSTSTRLRVSVTFVDPACDATKLSLWVEQVFDEIASHDPLFFIHMGDLHYANLDVNDVAAFRGAYESMFASPAGTVINDVILLDDPLDTIQQAFTIGRVRFLVTDLRSQRTPNDAPDIPSKTILGLDQKQWFKDQLQAATTSEGVGLVVWVNTMPWIDDERKWGHFTHEQNDLVAFFATLDLTSIPLVIVSGDAHMLAVDDGSHSPGNITTFHAAALGRPGSIKGGPYSHGAFPGSGQFGLLDVRDDGTRICVRYSGRRGATELLTYDTCEPSVPGTYTPYIPPSKPVRVVTRTLKKFLSRLDKKWQVVTRFYGWVAAMALVVGGVGVVGGVVWWCGCHRSVGKPKHD